MRDIVACGPKLAVATDSHGWYIAKNDFAVRGTPHDENKDVGDDPSRRRRTPLAGNRSCAASACTATVPLLRGPSLPRPDRRAMEERLQPGRLRSSCGALHLSLIHISEPTRL